MPTIKQHREFFAQFLVRSVGSSNERLAQAFAAVAREDFLGKGPWPVFVGSGYIDTISADPRLLYQDILIGLATDRGIRARVKPNAKGFTAILGRKLAGLAFSTVGVTLVLPGDFDGNRYDIETS